MSTSPLHNLCNYVDTMYIESLASWFSVLESGFYNANANCSCKVVLNLMFQQNFCKHFKETTMKEYIFALDQCARSLVCHKVQKLCTPIDLLTCALHHSIVCLNCAQITNRHRHIKSKQFSGKLACFY